MNIATISVFAVTEFLLSLTPESDVMAVKELKFDVYFFDVRIYADYEIYLLVFID